MIVAKAMALTFRSAYKCELLNFMVVASSLHGVHAAITSLIVIAIELAFKLCWYVCLIHDIAHAKGFQKFLRK